MPETVEWPAAGSLYLEILVASALASSYEQSAFQNTSRKAKGTARGTACTHIQIFNSFRAEW